MTETTQWEYRSVTLGSFWNPPRDEELEAALDELGVEGWEVVSAVALQNTNKFTILAKRPLSSETRRQRSWP